MDNEEPLTKQQEDEIDNYWYNYSPNELEKILNIVNERGWNERIASYYNNSGKRWN